MNFEELFDTLEEIPLDGTDSMLVKPTYTLTQEQMQGLYASKDSLFRLIEKYLQAASGSELSLVAKKGLEKRLARYRAGQNRLDKAKIIPVHSVSNCKHEF